MHIAGDLFGSGRARDDARHRRSREQPAEGELQQRDVARSAEGVKECAPHPARTKPRAGVVEDSSAGIFTAVGHL